MIKIPTTLQGIFNIVSTHLLKQNARSTDCEGTCMYRGKDGTKCAAGCLIPNDQYKKQYEYCTWSTLQREGLVPSKFSDEIQELQRIHDYGSISGWPAQLKEFAKHHNLEFNCTIS